MKLDPGITPEQIKSLLRSQAEQVHGERRAEEIDGQLDHLANMLAEVAQRELELAGSPPDASGIPDRSVR
jgi:hypothetical protein